MSEPSGPAEATAGRPSNQELLKGLQATPPRTTAPVPTPSARVAPPPPPAAPPASAPSVSPRLIAAPPPPPPGVGAPAGSPASKNNLGTTALVLGIIGIPLGALPLVWVVPVMAIVFGAKGVKASNRGEATNKTMALWGMWLGIVGVPLAAFMSLGIAMSPR